MWLILAIVATLAWGWEEIFLKSGTAESPKYAPLRIAVCLGMGAAVLCLVCLPFSESGLSLPHLIRQNYLFFLVPLVYGLALLISNIGYRYLDASVFAPLENAAGAFPPLLFIIWFACTGELGSLWNEISPLDAAAAGAVVVGILWLAFMEHHRKLAAIAAHSAKRGGATAFLFPLVFCLVDAFDTFLCGAILGGEIGEGMGKVDYLILYSLTFVVIGIVCWCILYVKRGRVFNPLLPQFAAFRKAAALACCAQVSYVFAMAENPLYTAPIVAAFGIVTVVISPRCLGERLTPVQYVAIALVLAGVFALGVSEGLEYLEN